MHLWGHRWEWVQPVWGGRLVVQPLRLSQPPWRMAPSRGPHRLVIRVALAHMERAGPILTTSYSHDGEVLVKTSSSVTSLWLHDSRWIQHLATLCKDAKTSLFKLADLLSRVGFFHWASEWCCFQHGPNEKSPTHLASPVASQFEQAHFSHSCLLDCLLPI